MVHRAALFEGYSTHTCVSTIYFEGKQKFLLAKWNLYIVLSKSFKIKYLTFAWVDCLHKIEIQSQ